MDFKALFTLFSDTSNKSLILNRKNVYSAQLWIYLDGPGAHFFMGDRFMEDRKLIQDVGKIVEPTVESLGYELIEIEYTSENGRWILRFYIDKEEGLISLGDCQKVSRAVNALLDVEDVVPGRYHLEVSSPGFSRPIRKEKDFKKYTGSEVKIKTVDKIDGRKNFRGIIEGIEEGVVKVVDSGMRFEIPVEEIFKARLVDAG